MKLDVEMTLYVIFMFVPCVHNLDCSGRDPKSFTTFFGACLIIL